MRYENRTFENETILIDDNEYIDCIFNSCRLLYAGGAVEFTPFKATELKLEFVGAARGGADMKRKLIEAGAKMAPVGAYLQIGDVWFQRIDKKPDHID